MSTPPYANAAPLRVLVAHLLPPRAASLEALSALAERLRALEDAGDATRAEAHLLLLEGGLAAQPALCRVARAQTQGLTEAATEEVVAELMTRLGRLYDGWQGTGSFRAYLTRVLVRDAWAATAQEGAHHRAESPLDPRDSLGDPDEITLSPLHVQALRRFAWYLYGSPDNPDRVQSDKALMDYLAYCARLERRPFSELVRDLQPRPGSWDIGRGEADCKWWRGRAQMAQRRVEEALRQPKYLAVYTRILSELSRSMRPMSGGPDL